MTIMQQTFEKTLATADAALGLAARIEAALGIMRRAERRWRSR